MNSSRRPAAREEHSLADLLLWRHDVPGAKHAALPPSTSRPNPLVLSDLVVASVFSPGQIVAVERGGGEPRWSFEPGRFGGSAVSHAAGVLLAKSSNTLHALEPSSGHLLWSFCPYEEMAESIYSQPVVDAERLFIGDRSGVLHCLDVRSGEVLWQRQTSPEYGANVNATALVHGELVLTANNDGQCLALDKASGEIVWQQALDGASIDEVQRFRGHALVRTRHSIYGIEPESGEVAWRPEWREAQISAVAVAGAGEDAMLVVATREPRTQEHGKRNVPAEEAPRSELLGLDGQRTLWVRRGAYYPGAMRWDAGTGLVYESRIDGFSIIEPRTGERGCNIVSDDAPERISMPGLASVHDGIIYLLCGRGGSLLALRHP